MLPNPGLYQKRTSSIRFDTKPHLGQSKTNDHNRYRLVHLPRVCHITLSLKIMEFTPIWNQECKRTIWKQEDNVVISEAQVTRPVMEKVTRYFSAIIPSILKTTARVAIQRELTKRYCDTTNSITNHLHETIVIISEDQYIEHAPLQKKSRMQQPRKDIAS